MKTIYFNIRTVYGVETVDQFTKENEQTSKEFRMYVNSMLKEYHISGQNVYKSQRCTNDYKN